jgi:putative Mg2+ transporter-C (MgtC) family protein
MAFSLNSSKCGLHDALATTTKGDGMNHFDFVLRIGVAILLGSVVGIERQWRQRMAGLRTNALVSAGASLFVSLSQMIPTGGDQSRIASYVVSGIGFLGAGVIMKDGGSIRGLNTAATLWCSAAVGALSGFGFYFEATIGALAIVGMHLCLRPFAQIINRQKVEFIEQDIHYQMKIVCKEEVESQIRYLVLQAVNATTLVLQSIRSVDLNGGTQKVEVSADLDCNTKQDQVLEQVVGRLGLEKGVSAVGWKIRGIGEEIA